MAAFINTNVASLNAQRNLTTSQAGLNNALQRLSSGLRINSSKDDAAGLAISDRMTAQIRGLNQATRNANDGISLAQTAEGALGEVGNNLQRIRELAVQSANATNSASDRAALDSEAQQLIAEISRVATQTSFNGLNLLDGSFQSKDFQVGANANQTIRVSSIANAQASALGSHTLTANGTITGDVINTSATNNGVTAVLAAANFKISTGQGGTSAAIAYGANSGANDIAAAINSAAASVGVTATASNTAEISAISAAGDLTFNVVGGTNSAAVSATITNTSDLTAVVQAINGVAGTTGVTAEFATPGDKSKIKLTANNGQNIGIGTYTNTGAAGATMKLDTATLTEGAATDSGIKTGTISLSSSKGAISTAAASAEVFAGAVSQSTFSSVSALSLSSAEGAQSAISVIDAALSSVNASRADLGAYQNRFTSAIASLQASSENMSASRSRIMDADFAQETAALTRGQILQQAGTAMLAQANSLPNGVLALLRG